MGIDGLQKVNLKYIDTLIEIIERFYDIEHFTEDGVSFTYGDKPNIGRVRFLLENIMTNNIETLSLGDEYDLIEIFSNDVINYLKEHLEIENYINDTSEFRLFLQKLFSNFILLKKHIEKSGLLWDIKKTLVNNLLTDNEIDTKNFRKEMEAKKYKVINIIGNTKLPIFLIDTKQGQIFFIDVLNSKIIYECGDIFEKGYTFGDKKIFIFDEKNKFDLALLKNEIITFNIQHSDATILDFLQYLKEKYHIQTDFSKVKSFEGLEDILKQNFGIINNNEFAIESLFFIMNLIDFSENKKNIFVSDTTGRITKLGSYNKYKTPSKIHNGYKEKEAIQLEVKDGNRDKVVVTNGEEYDIFDIE